MTAGTLLSLVAPAALAAYTSGRVDTTLFAFPDLGSFIQTLVRAIIIISGLAAFIFLVMGGFQYLTSGGDKVAAQSARDRITYAILGLAIVAGSIAVIQVLGAVFGVNILGNIQWPGPTTTLGQ
ncbi:MAG: hypothetical protein M1352_01410 [Patescibacteria group bacterium]|nr:hypothetical protein [Patescibacteria group bacterium]